MMTRKPSSTDSSSGNFTSTRRVASRRLSLSSLDNDSGGQPGANKGADRWAWLDLCPCSRASSSPSLQSAPSSLELEPSPATTCDEEPQAGASEKAVVTYQPRKYFEQSCYVAHHPSSRSRRFFHNRQRFANQHKVGIHNSAFTSSNVYVRPLPPSFTGRDLYELCMSMVRNARPAANRGGPTAWRKKFEIVSVKVMLDEDESGVGLGTCKGFGFCLWNCVEASSSCIQGLLENGYQANFARETSRGMLSSLADPTSANVYLSNLPHHWGEEDLKALFGDTPIASVRVLRDRDDEVVGSGTSRGVGFVRLACRSDALHFVELLHGMPIKGTNGYIQCRIADNLAQKEWKRNMRGNQRDERTLEPAGAAFRNGRDAMVAPSAKKWAPKKAGPRPPARVFDEPRPDGRLPPRVLGGGVSQAGPASFSQSTAEGGMCLVGLAPPLLMPPFHAPGGGGSVGATSPMTPPAGDFLFPVASLFPMFQPTWLATPRASFQAPHLPSGPPAWPPEYRLICGPELQPCAPDRLQPMLDERIWNSPPAESQSSSSSSSVWNTTTPHLSPPNNAPPGTTYSGAPSGHPPVPPAVMPKPAGHSPIFLSFGDEDFHHFANPTDHHHHYQNQQQQVFREVEPGVMGVVSAGTSGM